MKTKFRLVALLAIAALAAVFAQGPLTPPGAPAPTMKTLDQVEPRTPINDTYTPGDANYHHIISQPGSYYLTANFSMTKSNGIRVDVDGVTIDLKGFAIRRVSGSGGDGITVSGIGHRCTIKNGTIGTSGTPGFAYGVRCLSSPIYPRACSLLNVSAFGCSAAGLTAGDGWRLEGCSAHDNAGDGIRTNTGSSLTNCTASSNTGRGIVAGNGNSLTNCAAYDNNGTYGIFANDGSSLTNCSAYSNISAASSSVGIGTGDGCTITNCTAHFNSSTAAVSTDSTGMGFSLGYSSTIQGCTAADNLGDGISVKGNTLVRDNNSIGNGNFAGDAAGIHVFLSGGNRIEGNNVTDNDRGIDVDSARNVILRNSASGNTTNYVIVANNVFGAIVNRTAPASAAVSGNSAASSAGTTDPWANISY